LQHNKQNPIFTRLGKNRKRWETHIKLTQFEHIVKEIASKDHISQNWTYCKKFV